MKTLIEIDWETKKIQFVGDADTYKESKNKFNMKLVELIWKVINIHPAPQHCDCTICKTRDYLREEGLWSKI